MHFVEGFVVESMTVKAYAKVNLSLDVLRKREDGYHDVKMIMQNLGIYDELTFEVSLGEDCKITMSSNKDNIPLDEGNLVYKAIKLMMEEFDIKANIHVTLIKNIPVEAGMAGGSTDCAAAFRCMNKLFKLGLSVEELMKYGVRLGADVPYCILGETAISEGIGEVLTPCKGLGDCYVVVAKPPISVSTKMVYTNLKANELKEHPDVDGMAKALNEGSLTEVTSRMSNVLETVTVNLYKEIEDIKNIMKNQGALNAIMSGSGPTVFGIFEDKLLAEKVAKTISDMGLSKEIFVTTPVNKVYGEEA